MPETVNVALYALAIIGVLALLLKVWGTYWTHRAMAELDKAAFNFRGNPYGRARCIERAQRFVRRDYFSRLLQREK